MPQKDIAWGSISDGTPIASGARKRNYGQWERRLRHRRTTARHQMQIEQRTHILLELMQERDTFGMEDNLRYLAGCAGIANELS